MSSPVEASARPADLDRCPCGAGAYGGCCGPALDSGTPPATAVALMRSRYTAFALGRAGYLLETWHPSTRPATLDLDDGVRWRHLLIIDAVAGGPADRDGVVEFRAVYRDADGRGELHERSRFLRDAAVPGRAGGWRYLDGEHTE